ncbi:MAG: hypothetical protein GX346_08250 [Clostridiales bacterium]|nr:hypothetical protein [Clostridiales bacterium]
MNFILCNEKCKHQKDGYCSLEGSAMITNAVTSSANCCYFEKPDNKTLRLEKRGEKNG